ncbi:MAG: hypothetical protein GTO41_21200 [Burkholderiales bacterium]|nr:hypothetical protein [Burkholderiales bacterium]
MNISKVDAWFGLAGNIAILLGLVLLAVEIRDNTSAVRQQERGAKLEREHELLMAAAGNNLGASYVKLLYQTSEATPEEILDVAYLFTIRLTNLAGTYHAFRAGLVTEEDWELEVFIVPAFLNTAIGKVMWDELKAEYVPDFVDRVDRAIAESPLVPDDEWLMHVQQRLGAVN